MKRDRKTFKTFNNAYNAFLLQSPHAGMVIGDFADPVRRFWLDHKNESIIDELDLTKEQRREYRDYLNNLEFLDASLPDIEFEKEFCDKIKISIPAKLRNPDLRIRNEKIVKYRIGNVRSRMLKDTNVLEIRRIIEDGIKRMFKDEKREFKKEIGKINRTYIIDELMYSDEVYLEMESGYAMNAEVETELKGVKGLEFSVSHKSNNNRGYTIKGSPNVPFAAKIIRLEDL